MKQAKVAASRRKVKFGLQFKLTLAFMLVSLVVVALIGVAT